MPRKHHIEPGQVFGRLTTLERVNVRYGVWLWVCRCDCGNTTRVTGARLGSGHTRSCGCLRSPPSQRTHGESFIEGRATPEYDAWSNIRDRCLNPKAKNYPRYGGRGILVCERWLESYENFLSDMGRRPGPGYSIDRRDNDGNYEPGNCRWADKWQQANNRSHNHYLTFDGERMTLTQTTERAGADISLVRSRVKRGWDETRAITTPARSYGRE